MESVTIKGKTIKQGLEEENAVIYKRPPVSQERRTWSDSG